MKQSTLKLDAERRDAPRYEVQGVGAKLKSASLDVDAAVLDLSLNGALLESSEPLQREPGEAVSLQVSLEPQRCFDASARIVHCTDRRVGIEFLAFDPADFEVLSELIGQLRRAKVASLLSTPRE